MPYNVAECVKDLCIDEVVQAWVEQQQEATWMYGCMHCTMLYYSTHACMHVCIKTQCALELVAGYGFSLPVYLAMTRISQ